MVKYGKFGYKYTIHGSYGVAIEGSAQDFPTRNVMSSWGCETPSRPRIESTKLLGSTKKHLYIIPPKTNRSPENQWLVQMYFLVGIVPFFMGHVNLGGGFKHVLFSPLLGEMIQFD